MVGADWAGAGSSHVDPGEVAAFNGTAMTGRTAFQPIPCDGTRGEWRTNDLVRPRVPGLVDFRGLSAETFGKPNRDGSAVARSRSSLASAELLDGALRIEGAQGQVNVVQRRDGRIASRTVNGTTPGAIYFDGERQTFPETGPLEIPGVAKIERSVRTLIGKRGIEVTALRITLLDSNVVVKLGTARARIVR